VWGLDLAGPSAPGGGERGRAPAAPGAAALPQVGSAPGLLFLLARRVRVASRGCRRAPVVCLTPTGAVVTLGRVAAFCSGGTGRCNAVTCQTTLSQRREWKDGGGQLTFCDGESSSLGECGCAGSGPSRCCEQGSGRSYSGLSGSLSSRSPGLRSPPQRCSCHPHSQPLLLRTSVPFGSCCWRCGACALSAEWTGCLQSSLSADGASVEKNDDQQRKKKKKKKKKKEIKKRKKDK